jgi:thioredoxin reductase
MTGIGMGWDLFFYTKTPHLFRKLPEKVRLDRVRKTLGPAPGWFVRDQVDGKVPIHVSTNVVRARAEKGGVTLDLAHGEETRSAHFDHVIAATGYRVDITTLRILDQELRREIRLTNRSPRLSAHFESSVPGLYFVGVSAANSFGPVMRFAVGAEFTAPRIARRLAKAARRIAANETSTANAPVLKRT